MPANVDSMAYYGDPPWHGLGVSVPARATATEMINAAGLDWQVRMTPIPNVGVGAKAKARRCHLTRMPRNTSEQEVPLGVEAPDTVHFKTPRRLISSIPSLVTRK